MEGGGDIWVFFFSFLNWVLVGGKLEEFLGFNLIIEIVKLILSQLGWERLGFFVVI